MTEQTNFKQQNKLLFDVIAMQPNADGFYHGGGKYAKKVFEELLEIKQDKWKVFGFYDSKKWLDDEIKTKVLSGGTELIDVNEYSLQDACKKLNITRIYSALPYSLPGLEEADCEIIGTVHGLREFEVFVDWHAIKYYFNFKGKIKQIGKLLLRNSLLKRKFEKYNRLLSQMDIVAVSRHTQNSIINFFPKLNRDKVRLFYSADVTHGADVKLDETLQESDFFLLISGDRWLKNNVRPILALDDLFSKFNNIKNKVVITGVKQPNNYLKLIKNKERFIFFNYVSEGKLASLYSKCFSFIYMSLNEGFGYPPLEAMRFSKPVIASPVTSIPEICADGVIYANPYDIKEIQNRVLQLFDVNFYNQVSSKGSDQYKQVKIRQEDNLKEMLQFILN